MSVVVLGAGGHARVVVAILHSMGRIVDVSLDDDKNLVDSYIIGVPIVGPISKVESYRGKKCIIGIGSNRIRYDIDKMYSWIRWSVAIHPNSIVHRSAEIGSGSVVCAGAVVQPGAQIGSHAIINTGATVDHDAYVGDYAHLGPGVHLAGHVRVETGAMLGVGASVAPGTVVGAWGTVGAGAAVVHNLPANVTSVGVPARPLFRS